MSFSDMLANNNGGDDDLARLFGQTEAAKEFSALPAGNYEAHIIEGKLEASRTKGTPGYKLTFRVISGEHQGRRLWLDLWLTPAAMPHTKRDLMKLGVTTLGQLNQPLPELIRCKCKVVVRRNDEGNEKNVVRSFEVIGIDKTENPFAPSSTADTTNDLDPFFISDTTNQGGENDEIPF